MKLSWTAIFVLAALVVSARASELVEIGASRDTTIYSDLTSTPLSNGSGQYMFAGEVGENDNYNTRRAILYFDVAGVVPAGMTITSATMRVFVNQKPSTAQATDPFSLNLASQDWGEGGSDPSGPEGSGTSAQVGDATWYHTFYSTLFWNTSGGDFSASSSATLDIGDPGLYEFSSAQMIADVQAWLDAPAGNYGWFMLGDESTPQSTRRFYSTESGEDFAPTLVLGYDIVPEPRGLVMIGALLLIISNDWKNREKKLARLWRRRRRPGFQ